jgi:hypothetical protein
MSVARDFATVLTGFRAADLPGQPLENAAMLLASAAAGRGIVRELARERGGTPEATSRSATRSSRSRRKA